MLHWGTFQSIHTPHGEQVPQTPAHTDPSGYSFVDAPSHGRDTDTEICRTGVRSKASIRPTASKFHKHPLIRIHQDTASWMLPAPRIQKKMNPSVPECAARRRVAAEFSANVTVEGRFLALHRAAFISLLFPHATERAYRSA